MIELNVFCQEEWDKVLLMQSKRLDASFHKCFKGQEWKKQFVFHICWSGGCFFFSFLIDKSFENLTEI